MVASAQEVYRVPSDWSEAPPAADYPLVFEAIDLADDAFDVLRMAELVREVGGLAVAAVETGEMLPESTLLENIRLAANGDEEADKRVMMSCMTDPAERLLKTSAVAYCAMDVGEDDRLYQNEVPLEQVMRNTVRYASNNPVLQAITRADALNTFRLESARRAGILQTHYMIVESAVPDTLSKEQAREENFFVDTMSLSVQIFSEEDVEVTTGSTDEKKTIIVNQAGMLAGAVGKNAERHDITAMEYVAEQLGLERSGISTQQRIERAYFVHKSVLPDGFVSYARLYDESVGTFFGDSNDGQLRPPEDYRAKIQEGLAIQKDLEVTAKRIKQRLLANVDQLRTPIDAVRALDAISHQEALNKTLQDARIDARVFGAGAQYIEAARWYQQQGDIAAVQANWGLAQQNASSTACPGSMKTNIDPLTGGNMNDTDDQENDAGDGKGPLKFKCLNGHDCERPFGGYLDECKKCKDGGKSVGCA